MRKSLRKGGKIKKKERQRKGNKMERDIKKEAIWEKERARKGSKARN